MREFVSESADSQSDSNRF